MVSARTSSDTLCVSGLNSLGDLARGPPYQSGRLRYGFQGVCKSCGTFPIFSCVGKAIPMPLAAQSYINKIFMLRLNLYSVTLWNPPSALGTPRYRGHLLIR